MTDREQEIRERYRAGLTRSYSDPADLATQMCADLLDLLEINKSLREQVEQQDLSDDLAESREAERSWKVIAQAANEQCASMERVLQLVKSKLSLHIGISREETDTGTVELTADTITTLAEAINATLTGTKE